MKVGDLVSVTMHTDITMIGLIEEVKLNPSSHDPIDAMFPYRICFSDHSYDDWYELSNLKVISESR
jgi:hypothetical protein